MKKQAALMQKIEQMGSGARIRVSMRNGAPALQGAIDQITPEEFVLKTQDRTQRFQYRQVEKVSLVDHSFKNGKETDPVRLRHVLADWGTGQKVRVELSEKGSFKGRVQAIEANNVTIIDAGTGLPRAVAYREIRDLRKQKFPAWGKAAIAVGAVLGILAGFMYAECGPGGC